VTAALEARNLGRRFGRTWALRECSLAVPAGAVAGLVGPNGAGKTTLLHLAVGLLRPSTGTIRVLGEPAGDRAGLLARIGFVAQDAPLYGELTAAEHLTMGARLNRGFDLPLARRRLLELGVPPDRRAGSLSGGQRAQVALTLALGKRPALLLLDEPVAGLDPLARRAFLESLARGAAEQGLTVLLSSHVVADLERVCDWLVVLSAARVQALGPVGELLARHRPPAAAARGTREATLEELVLAYLGQAGGAGPGIGSRDGGGPAGTAAEAGR